MLWRSDAAAYSAAPGQSNSQPMQMEAPPAEEPHEPLPDVEWWDVRILQDKNSMPEIAGELQLAIGRARPANELGCLWLAREASELV